MEYCFWVILSLMTGLTSTKSAQFKLFVKKGDTFTEYRVIREAELTWMVRYPLKNSRDSMTVYYTLSPDKSSFTCSHVPRKIELKQYFSGGKIKWDKVQKFTFKGKYQKEGEDDLMVIRSGRNIFLKQEYGSFTYYPVIYTEW